VRDEDKMDESSNDELFSTRDIRKKKEKKRSHKSTKDELTKESFKKLKEEIDELRKKEAEQSKELEQLKKKVESQNPDSHDVEIEYTLGFNKDEYLSKGFIESAQWIKNVVAENMKEKLMKPKYALKFEAMIVSKKFSTHMGIRTCARYNRGEDCTLGKWHTTYRDMRQGAFDARHRINPQNESDRDQSTESKMKRNELRLHACTLCLEALMSIHGHSVLNCPWIQKRNWN